MTLLKIEKEINISSKYTISQHARGKMVNIVKSFSSIQFSSVAQTLWDPMNTSMPGLPILHKLP